MVHISRRIISSSLMPAKCNVDDSATLNNREHDLWSSGFLRRMVQTVREILPFAVCPV